LHSKTVYNSVREILNKTEDAIYSADERNATQQAMPRKYLLVFQKNTSKELLQLL